MNAKEMKRQVSRQEWQKIIINQKASNMSVQEYCIFKELSLNSFYYWQRKIREAACTSIEASKPTAVADVKPEPVFAKTDIPVRSSSFGITIRTNESEIVISPDADPAHVRIVMEAFVYAQR